jgi:hypothetical protein
MTAISSLTIRRARRDDIGVIVAMLADDPLVSARAARAAAAGCDAQRFYVRLGFQPSHVGMTLRF